MTKSEVSESESTLCSLITNTTSDQEFRWNPPRRPGQYRRRKCILNIIYYILTQRKVTDKRKEKNIKCHKKVLFHHDSFSAHHCPCLWTLLQWWTPFFKWYFPHKALQKPQHMNRIIVMHIKSFQASAFIHSLQSFIEGCPLICLLSAYEWPYIPTEEFKSIALFFYSSQHPVK